MKFGEQLRSSVIKEFEWSYIDYDGLKSLLKIPSGEKWTEDRESKFIDALDEQLDRVYTRQKSKAGEIERRIETSRREVDDVVARLDSRGPVGSGGDGDAPTEEEFMMLEQDLGEIIADVHDLAKFVQVNYTGFQKIIKKHDVSTGGSGAQVEGALTIVEKNWMDAQACVCDETKEEPFLQGQLRCGYC